MEKSYKMQQIWVSYFSFLLSGSIMDFANLVWYNRIPSVYEQLMSVGDNSMSSLHKGTIDKNYFQSTSTRC